MSNPELAAAILTFLPAPIPVHRHTLPRARPPLCSACHHHCATATPRPEAPRPGRRQTVTPNLRATARRWRSVTAASCTLGHRRFERSSRGGVVAWRTGSADASSPHRRSGRARRPSAGWSKVAGAQNVSSVPPTLIWSRSCSWNRPATGRPLTKVPLRDKPLSMIHHTPAARSRVECKRETSRSLSMTMSPDVPRPIVTNPASSGQQHCSAFASHLDRQGSDSGPLAGATTTHVAVTPDSLPDSGRCPRTRLVLAPAVHRNAPVRQRRWSVARAPTKCSAAFLDQISVR
jgi:hypothetical protein